MRRLGLIVLAAGGSRRMGRPKQLLPWGTSTLLRHACEAALATSCRPVVVVLGNKAEACHPLIKDLPVTVEINPNWELGLGSSIAVGIMALEKQSPAVGGALVMLADQPTVKPALLNALISKWSPPLHSIAATSYDGEGGVPAVFDRTFFSELCSLDSQRGARPLIMRENARTILVEPGETLIDIDTPDNYSRHVPSQASKAATIEPLI